MSTETKAQPVSSSPPSTSAVRVAGTAAAVGAAVTVWLLARFGAGMTLRQPAFSATGRPAHLAIGFVIAAAAVASVAGWGVASLIGRTTRRPRATWVIVARAATVVSLSMPFSGHGVTVTQRVALALMHLAVAAVLIPVLAATLSAQRPWAPPQTPRFPAGDTAQPAARSPRWPDPPPHRRGIRPPTSPGPVTQAKVIPAWWNSWAPVA
jgi:hypothetical protein